MQTGQWRPANNHTRGYVHRKCVRDCGKCNFHRCMLSCDFDECDARTPPKPKSKPPKRVNSFPFFVNKIRRNVFCVNKNDIGTTLKYDLRLLRIYWRYHYCALFLPGKIIQTPKNACNNANTSNHPSTSHLLRRCTLEYILLLTFTIIESGNCG